MAAREAFTGELKHGKHRHGGKPPPQLTQEEKMSEEKPLEPPAQTWAVVELMGHRQAIGAISETIIAGRQMLTVVRVDTEPEGQVQHYGPESVYCLTPVTEDEARLIASQRYKTHVVPPVLMAGVAVGDEDDEVWDFADSEDDL